MHSQFVSIIRNFGRFRKTIPLELNDGRSKPNVNIKKKKETHMKSHLNECSVTRWHNMCPWGEI